MEWMEVLSWATSTSPIQAEVINFELLDVFVYPSTCSSSVWHTQATPSDQLPSFPVEAPVGHCYERWEPYSIQQVLAQLTYSKFMTADEEQSLLHNNIQNSDSSAANTRFILKPGRAGLLGWFHSSSLDICTLIQPNSPSLSSYITIIKMISLSLV